MNPSSVSPNRLHVLDGWRGLCILFVLATHLLPMGPNHWQINLASGILGIVIFFVLSGFLITSFLLSHTNLVDFLIRRLFRILPLAWLAMAISMWFMPVDGSFWLANFLFYANWPPMALGDLNGHLWSLCVEIQFYIGIALMVFLLPKKWTYLIPLLCLAVTSYRALNGAYANINTYYRIDEILAGSILALCYAKRMGPQILKLLTWVNPVYVLILLAVSCHPQGEALNYFRPYLAATLIGSTLVNRQTAMSRALDNRVLFYIATISYALYVLHPLLAHTWLGSGVGIEKYAKRPLLFAVIFLVAHVSTFYYEKWWITLGHRLSKRITARGSIA